APLADEGEPVPDVVVYRAFPLAERVATGQAAAGLLGGAMRIERRIDLAEGTDALGDRHLLGLAALEFQKLQCLVNHARSSLLGSSWVVRSVRRRARPRAAGPR